MYHQGLDVRSEFGVAEALRNNYYDPGHPPETLRAMIAGVERLVDKVEEWISSIQRKAGAHILQPPAHLPESLLRVLTTLAPRIFVPRRLRA